MDPQWQMLIFFLMIFHRMNLTASLMTLMNREMNCEMNCSWSRMMN
jgi:hypothetical protein